MLSRTQCIRMLLPIKRAKNLLYTNQNQTLNPYPILICETQNSPVFILRRLFENTAIFIPLYRNSYLKPLDNSLNVLDESVYKDTLLFEREDQEE